MGALGTRRLLERANTKAAVTTADIVASGRLNPEQADRFIDYVIDVSQLFRSGIRVRRMRADRADLDRITVGTRVLRAAVENTEPADLVGITTAKRQLSVTEIILPVDVTFSFFEDNIERENFQDHLMMLMATTLSNDLEDLAINGDGVTTPFLSIEQGWLTLLKVVSADQKRFDTAGSDDFRNIVWKGMLATLPVKFKGNKSLLRYFTSVTNEEKYRFQLGQRQTAGGDQILMGGGSVTYDGIPVVGIPLMPDTDHLLGLPDNLVFGIRRDVTLGIFKHERKRHFEYTWTLRVDFQIVTPEATVIGYDF